MNCAQFESAIEALRTGAPGAAICDQFRSHARSCPSCATRFAPYLKTKCSEITDFLADYFDGSLQGDTRQVFDFHINACPECRCYLDSYALTVRRTRELSVASEPAPQRLIDAILAARRAQSN